MTPIWKISRARVEVGDAARQQVYSPSGPAMPSFLRAVSIQHAETPKTPFNAQIMSSSYQQHIATHMLRLNPLPQRNIKPSI